TSSGSGICVPGRDGVPDNAIGHLMCGDWAFVWPAAVWSWLTGHWPMALAGLALGVATVIAARVGIVVAVRAAWAARTDGAVWLRITPPAGVTAVSTTQLWRLLTQHLPHR